MVGGVCVGEGESVQIVGTGRCSLYWKYDIAFGTHIGHQTEPHSLVWGVVVGGMCVGVGGSVESMVGRYATGIHVGRLLVLPHPWSAPVPLAH